VSEQPADDTTAADRKRRYRRAVRIVEHNTGGAEHPQPPTASEPSVIGTAVRAGIDPDRTRSVIQAALGEDLVRFDDRSLARFDRRALLDVIETEAQSDQPDRHRVAWCNQLLDIIS
jgi:hypothetical protein